MGGEKTRHSAPLGLAVPDELVNLLKSAGGKNASPMLLVVASAYSSQYTPFMGAVFAQYASLVCAAGLFIGICILAINAIRYGLFGSASS